MSIERETNEAEEDEKRKAGAKQRNKSIGNEREAKNETRQTRGEGNGRENESRHGSECGDFFWTWFFMSAVCPGSLDIVSIQESMEVVPRLSNRVKCV